MDVSWREIFVVEFIKLPNADEIFMSIAKLKCHEKYFLLENAKFWFKMHQISFFFFGKNYIEIHKLASKREIKMLIL